MMFFTDTRWQRKLACYAPLPLRLIVGYGFMAHGYAKLMKGPDAFVAIGTPWACRSRFSWRG